MVSLPGKHLILPPYCLSEMRRRGLWYSKHLACPLAPGRGEDTFLNLLPITFLDLASQVVSPLGFTTRGCPNISDSSQARGLSAHEPCSLTEWIPGYKLEVMVLAMLSISYGGNPTGLSETSLNHSKRLNNSFPHTAANLTIPPNPSLRLTLVWAALWLVWVGRLGSRLRPCLL